MFSSRPLITVYVPPPEQLKVTGEVHVFVFPPNPAAVSPLADTDPQYEYVVSELVFENAFAPMSETLVGIIRDARAVAPLNVSLSIMVKVLGKVTEVKVVIKANEFSYRAVTPSGIVMEVKAELLQKA
jgi:hypothetical protein